MVCRQGLGKLCVAVMRRHSDRAADLPRPRDLLAALARAPSLRARAAVWELPRACRPRALPDRAHPPQRARAGGLTQPQLFALAMLVAGAAVLAWPQAMRVL